MHTYSYNIKRKNELKKLKALYHRISKRLPLQSFMRLTNTEYRN